MVHAISTRESILLSLDLNLELRSLATALYTAYCYFSLWWFAKYIQKYLLALSLVINLTRQWRGVLWGRRIRVRGRRLLGTSPGQPPVDTGIPYGPALVLLRCFRLCVVMVEPPPLWLTTKTVYFCNGWCNDTSCYVDHNGQFWDCDCMHNGCLGPSSPGLHRAGIRAILTLGDPS